MPTGQARKTETTHYSFAKCTLHTRTASPNPFIGRSPSSTSSNPWKQAGAEALQIKRESVYANGGPEHPRLEHSTRLVYRAE